MSSVATFILYKRVCRFDKFDTTIDACQKSPASVNTHHMRVMWEEAGGCERDTCISARTPKQCPGYGESARPSLHMPFKKRPPSDFTPQRAKTIYTDPPPAHPEAPSLRCGTQSRARRHRHATHARTLIGVNHQLPLVTEQTAASPFRSEDRGGLACHLEG